MPSKEEIITPQYIDNLKKRIASLENAYNDQHSKSVNGDCPKGGDSRGKVENCTQQPNPRITPASIIVPAKNSIIVPGIYGTIKNAVNNLESHYSNNCCQSYHCQTCQQECTDIECDEHECTNIECKECSGSTSTDNTEDTEGIDTRTPGTPGEYYGNTGIMYLGAFVTEENDSFDIGNGKEASWKNASKASAADLVDYWEAALAQGNELPADVAFYDYGCRFLNWYLKYHYNQGPWIRRGKQARESTLTINRSGQTIQEFTLRHPIPYFDTGSTNNYYPDMFYNDIRGGFSGYRDCNTYDKMICVGIIVYQGSQRIQIVGGTPVVYSKYNTGSDSYPFWYRYETTVYNNQGSGATYKVGPENGYYYKISSIELGKPEDIEWKDYSELTKRGHKLLKYLVHHPHYEPLTRADRLFVPYSDSDQAFKKEPWRITIVAFQRNTRDTQGMRVCMGRDPFVAPATGVQYAPLSFSISYWDFPTVPISNGEETCENGIKNLGVGGYTGYSGRYGEVIELQQITTNMSPGDFWQDVE